MNSAASFIVSMRSCVSVAFPLIADDKSICLCSGTKAAFLDCFLFFRPESIINVIVRIYNNWLSFFLIERILVLLKKMSLRKIDIFSLYFFNFKLYIVPTSFISSYSFYVFFK